VPLDAPNPQHDAIRRGRELAAKERREPGLHKAVRLAHIFMVIAVLGCWAWASGATWMRVAIISIGGFAIVAWLALRWLNSRRQRRQLHARLEHSRRRR